MLELDIGGGSMNKEQAKKEYEKIMLDVAKKHEEIEKKAREDGTWQKWGLDSNNALFKQVDNEAKENIQILASMIDED